MDMVPWPQVGVGSGWALVVLVVVLFVRGKIWTDAAYQQKVHEANEWRTEARIKDQQIRELEIHLQLLSEVGKTTDAIMRSIHRNAQSGDRGSREETP